MTGGDDSSDASKSYEIVDENESILGSELPWEFSNHCSVKLNETHAILTGGTIYPFRTLIVNLNNLNMTQGPNIAVNRNSHACSRLSHPNGTNYIIIAGGYTRSYRAAETVDIEASTEILDVNNIAKGWYQGKT